MQMPHNNRITREILINNTKLLMSAENESQTIGSKYVDMKCIF